MIKLADLLCKVNEYTTVWVAEDPAKSEGIYFGAVRDMKLRATMGYEVVEIYPEHYPAINNFAGLSIIVRRSPNE